MARGDEEGLQEPRVEEREVRRLSRVHLVALLIVALLLIAAQVVTQAALVGLEGDGRALLELAGQMTPAQELGQIATEFAEARDEAQLAQVRARLAEHQIELERFQKRLDEGGLALSGPAAARLADERRALDQAWQGTAATIRSLLARPPPVGPAAEALVSELTEGQAAYRSALGDLARACEADNRARITRLRRLQLGLLAGLLVVVLAEGLLMLRPAVASVRRSLASAWATEDKLRRSEAGKRAILAAIPDQLVRIYRREAFLELKTGRPEPVPHGLSPKAWPQLAAVAGPYVDQALRDGIPQEFSFQVPVPGGVRHLQVRLVVSGEDEVLAIVQDVTERRDLEQRLLDAGTQERERLGHDLHDGLCQHLAGTGLVMRTLMSRMQKDQPLSFEDLETAARLVGEATEEARAMARGLVPVTVERLGLEAALEQVAEDLRKVHGTPVVADLDLGMLEPDDQMAIQLFRIAHEAATNAAKHAQAESILLRLREEPGEDGQLLLEVIDDGVGISSERRADSMGLRIMDYRARLIGGFLQVEARPEGGTRVSCRLSNVPDGRPGERSGLYTLPS